MKKLLLLAVSLVSGSILGDAMLDMHMIIGGKEIHKQNVLNAENKFWYTALEDDLVFVSKMTPEGEDKVIIEMNVFKKNEKGENILVATPKITMEWSKPAELRFSTKTEAGDKELFALRIIANK